MQTTETRTSWFIESEKYDNELKEFLDDRETPVFFYDLKNHLNLDDYDPSWGSGLPAYLVSETKLTDDQIETLHRAEYPEVWNNTDEEVGE